MAANVLVAAAPRSARVAEQWPNQYHRAPPGTLPQAGPQRRESADDNTGEVPEWSNGADSKSVDRVIGPGVRIPPSPPYTNEPAQAGFFVYGGEGLPMRAPRFDKSRQRFGRRRVRINSSVVARHGARRQAGLFVYGGEGPPVRVPNGMALALPLPRSRRPSATGSHHSATGPALSSQALRPSVPGADVAAGPQLTRPVAIVGRTAARLAPRPRSVRFAMSTALARNIRRRPGWS